MQTCIGVNSFQILPLALWLAEREMSHSVVGTESRAGLRKPRVEIIC